MYARSRTTLSREHGFEPVRVEGTIPEALRGTLYRVGGALHERFGVPYDHIFEGDGGVLALRLSEVGAEYAHRIIRGGAFEREERAGKPLYGPGASRARRIWNALRMDIKNTANTSLLRWGDRLFGLMEAAKPTELDAATLETLGETDFDGVVAQKFSAHPHRVVSRQTTFNFGLRYGPFPKLDLYALPDVGPAKRLTTIGMRKNWMVHDFAMTARHAVFVVCPVRFCVPRVLLGAGFDDFFEWLPKEGTEVIVVPLDAPHDILRFESETWFQWHVLGAHDRGSDIILELSAFDNFDSIRSINTDTGPQHGATLTRVVIDTAKRRVAREPFSDIRADFPRIDERVAGDHRFGFFVSTSTHRGIHRIDPQTGASTTHALEDHEHPSEAVFVPRTSSSPEADGYLLSPIYDDKEDACHVRVVDTARLPDAPVAKIHLGCAIPLTTHGLWWPATGHA